MNIWVDMWIDISIDKCMDMRIDMCIDIRIDMWSDVWCVQVAWAVYAVCAARCGLHECPCRRLRH